MRDCARLLRFVVAAGVVMSVGGCVIPGTTQAVYIPKFGSGKPSTDVATAQPDPLPASTQPPSQQAGRMQVCLQDTSYFNYAATYRDMNLSPQEAYARMRPMITPSHPAQYVKNVINIVYFDPDISSMSPEQIIKVVTEDCVHPRRAYAPVE
jgi:hypothetical protein